MPAVIGAAPSIATIPSRRTLLPVRIVTVGPPFLSAVSTTARGTISTTTPVAVSTTARGTISTTTPVAVSTTARGTVSTTTPVAVSTTARGTVSTTARGTISTTTPVAVSTTSTRTVSTTSTRAVSTTSTRAVSTRAVSTRAVSTTSTRAVSTTSTRAVSTTSTTSTTSTRSIVPASALSTYFSWTATTTALSARLLLRAFLLWHNHFHRAAARGAFRGELCGTGRRLTASSSWPLLVPNDFVRVIIGWPFSETTQRLFASVTNLVEHAADVGDARGVLEPTGELDLRVEVAPLVKPPDFLAVPGLQKLGRKPPQEAADVVHVADEQLAGVVVEGGIDGLGKVDDDRPRVSQQHVEVRQVAVDHARAEHLHDLREHRAVDVSGFGRSEVDIDEARCRHAGLAFNQLHHQHTFVELEGLRHDDAGSTQLADGVNLCRSPGLLDLATTELAPLVHRALSARIADLATFCVVGAVLEATPSSLFIDLGDPQLFAGLYQVDRRFLAAHQRSNDSVNDAHVEQRQ